MANKFTVDVLLPTLTSEEIGSDSANPEVVKRQLVAKVADAEVFNQVFDAGTASVTVGSVDVPLLQGQSIDFSLFNIDDAGLVSVTPRMSKLDVTDTTPPPTPGEMNFKTNEI